MQVTESSADRWGQRGQTTTSSLHTQSQNAVWAMVYVDCLHTKQTKPNLFLTTVINLFEWTFAACIMRRFSRQKWDYLQTFWRLQSCLRGPRWRNVQRPQISGGLAVPSGGHMTERGCSPSSRLKGLKELKAWRRPLVQHSCLLFPLTNTLSTLKVDFFFFFFFFLLKTTNKV